MKKKRIVKLEPQTVELFAEVLSKLRPPPPLTVSQWADRYRVLSAESSAEPGRWHTEKAPYQRAIMDAIGDPHVRSVVVMSAAQIGKTDAFILNPLGYYMDYFAVKEFRCKDGTDPIFIDDVLVKLLQNIRNHFGKAVTITSAYRTAAHNKAVKGATYSQHCYGMAADIRIQGVDVETLATYAETLLKNTGGIGRYPVKTGRPAGWVHIDTRAVKSRWVG